MLAADDQIRQVQQATDLVALVGQHVRLQPRGKEFVGLCPFHDDHKPSMYVSPAKQIYKCFSCGAGGDALGWMVNYHKMSFPEALRMLAEQAGIQLKPLRGGAVRDRDELADLMGANAKALAFFRARLGDAAEGRGARAYIAERGINAEMVEQFQLGYAPNRWDGMAQAIERQGWDLPAFRKVGLVSQRSQGPGDFDRLRHRLIFPICDGLGRPVAFGGRILPDATRADPREAKYLNSPESPLFNKSQTLYGLHLARRAIIDSQLAVVVEGYTDVIACHQHGLVNVVATLGTALTAGHATQLRRVADRVVLVFDVDEAGQKAADRAVEIFLGSGLEVAVAILRAPDGRAGDPADLLAREDGVALWNQAIAGAADALSYQFERLRERFDAAGSTGARERLAEDYIRQLADIGLARQSLIRRALTFQRLADLLKLSPRQVADMVERVAGRRPAAPPPAGDPGAQPAGGGVIGLSQKKKDILDIARSEPVHRIKALTTAERHLIGGLLALPRLFHEVTHDGRPLDEALTDTAMISAPAQRLYAMIHEHLGQNGDLTLAGLLADLARTGEPELADLATRAEAEVEGFTEGDEERIADLVAAAARSLLTFHDERTHRAARDRALRGDADSGPVDADRLLKEVYDHQRANRPGVRIGRIEN